VEKEKQVSFFKDDSDKERHTVHRGR
jgi:hypothetical protein